MIDEMEAVRRLGATAAEPDPAARERVRARIAPAPQKRRRRWSLAFVPAGAVALGIALVVLVGGGSPDDTFDGSRPAQGPSLFPAPDQYLYVRRTMEGISECAERRPGKWKCTRDSSTYETWVSETKTGRTLPKLPRRLDGSANEMRPVQLKIGDHEFTHDELATYDPTPQELLATLGRPPTAAGEDPRMAQFNAIAGALGDRPMPPNARRALIGALPLIRGTTPGREVRDSRGRRGVLYSRVDRGQRVDVIVDPQDFVLLERQDTKVGRMPNGEGIKVGELIGRIVYLERAVTADTKRP